jgi:hypothetical protein
MTNVRHTAGQWPSAPAATSTPVTPGLAPNRSMAQEFVELLAGNGDGDVMFLTMLPNEGKPSAHRGDYSGAQALKDNASGENLYFGVNIVKQGVHKKPTKAEIETIRAVGGDNDWNRKKFKGRFAEGMKELSTTVLTPLLKMTPQPTLIIFTGGGLQPMWFIEPLPNPPENRDRAEAVGAYIADRFGGVRWEMLIAFCVCPARSTIQTRISATPGNQSSSQSSGLSAGKSINWKNLKRRGA